MVVVVVGRAKGYCANSEANVYVRDRSRRPIGLAGPGVAGESVIVVWLKHSTDKDPLLWVKREEERERERSCHF